MRKLELIIITDPFWTRFRPIRYAQLRHGFKLSLDKQSHFQSAFILLLCTVIRFSDDLLGVFSVQMKGDILVGTGTASDQTMVHHLTALIHLCSTICLGQVLELYAVFVLFLCVCPQHSIEWRRTFIKYLHPYELFSLHLNKWATATLIFMGCRKLWLFFTSSKAHFIQSTSWNMCV